MAEFVVYSNSASDDGFIILLMNNLPYLELKNINTAWRYRIFYTSNLNPRHWYVLLGLHVFR